MQLERGDLGGESGFEGVRGGEDWCWVVEEGGEECSEGGFWVRGTHGA